MKVHSLKIAHVRILGDGHKVFIIIMLILGGGGKEQFFCEVPLFESRSGDTNDEYDFSEDEDGEPGLEDYDSVKYM